MGTSNTRAARRAAAAQSNTAAPGRSAALQTVAAPERQTPPDIPEINFEAMPGPLLGTGLLGKRGLHKKAKSLRIPATLDAHIAGFLSHEPHVSFQDATEALWRVMLRAEHEVRERAMAVHRQTGLPVQITHSQIYQLLDQELVEMKAEASTDVI